MKMKSYGKLLAALFACMAVVAVLLVQSCAAIADDGYFMVNGKKYADEDIKEITKPDSSVVKDGATIEVYGKVKLPLIIREGTDPKYPDFTWVLSHDNVVVEGKTADAAVYCPVDVNSQDLGGMGGLQSTVHVEGDGVTFKNVAILPNYNSYYSDGYANKTVEVWGASFTMEGCTIEVNDLGDGRKTENGGALFFNGAKENITVTDSTFKDCYVVFCDADPAGVITISGNTFDSPQGDTYFIGNNTWANPPSDKMGPVYVENNIFKNLPADYKKVVYHRMEGTFYLKGNKIESSQGSDKLLDRVSFGRLYGTYQPEGGKDCASGGRGIIMLEEGGAKYKITAKLDNEEYVNVETLIKENDPNAKPVAPELDEIPANVETIAPKVISVDITTATEDDKAAARKKTADMINAEGVTPSDIEFDKNGQAALSEKIIASAAVSAVKLAELPDGTTVEPEDIAPLPITDATVSAGNVAAIAFELKGEVLKAALVKDVKVMKVMSAEMGEFFTLAAVPEDFTDKHFAIQAADENKVLSAESPIVPEGTYKLVLFIKDNGDFDLCKDEAGRVVDPVAIVSTTAPTPTPKPQPHGSSSSGCNTVGWGALVLLAALPLFRKKR